MKKIDIETLKRRMNNDSKMLSEGTMALTNNSLKVSQFINGEHREVFRAWIDHELANKWLCPESSDAARGWTDRGTPD